MFTESEEQIDTQKYSQSADIERTVTYGTHMVNAHAHWERMGFHMLAFPYTQCMNPRTPIHLYT